MTNGHVSRIPGSLLFVHIRESLASVVDNLIGTLQQVVDFEIHLELAIVLVHVANLALFVSCPDIFLKVLGV